MHSKNSVLLVRVSDFKERPRKGNPISEGYIAASLLENNIQTKIIDGFNFKNKEELLKEIKQEKSNIIGFSAYDSNINIIKEIAKEIKKQNEKIITIIGGPQAIFMPEKAILKLESIDIIARGDGEIQLKSIIKELNQGKKTSELKTRGLTIKIKDEIINTDKYEPKKLDLDKFKSPYLNNIFDDSKYNLAYVFFSRGCNFNCVFCHTPRAFRGVSYHSIERVIKELKAIKEKNYKEIMFVDPAFFSDKEKTKELLRNIIKEKINIPFWCESRFDEIDEESVILLKEAGVKKIAFGLETISERVLKKINKQNNKEKIITTLNWCKKYDVEVELMFMYGLPNETFQDAYETIKFLEKQKIPLKGNSSGQQMSIYFGTEIYTNPNKFGIKFKKEDEFRCPGHKYENETFSKAKKEIFKYIINKKRINGDEEKTLKNQ